MSKVEKLEWAHKPVLKTFVSEKNSRSWVRTFLNNKFIQIKLFCIKHRWLSLFVGLFLIEPIYIFLIPFLELIIIINDLIHLNLLGIIGALYDLFIFSIKLFLAVVFGVYL